MHKIVQRTFFQFCNNFLIKKLINYLLINIHIMLVILNVHRINYLDSDLTVFTSYATYVNPQFIERVRISCLSLPISKWLRNILRGDWEISDYLLTGLNPSSVNSKMSFGVVANYLLIIFVTLVNGMPQKDDTTVQEKSDAVSRKFLFCYIIIHKFLNFLW